VRVSARRNRSLRHRLAPVSSGAWESGGSEIAQITKSRARTSIPLSVRDRHLRARSHGDAGATQGGIGLTLVYAFGVRVGSLQLHEDLAPSEWVTHRIHDFASDVGSVIPEGFERYVRLLHPAFRHEGGDDVPVSWSEIAASNDRIVHPEMQWPHISGVWEHSGVTAPGLWDREPDVGTLPRTYATILSDFLMAHTATPDRVWFCVWEGWGGLRFHPVGRAPLTSGPQRRIRRRAQLPPPAPRVQLPARAYYLLSGPIKAVNESLEEPPSWQSANLWWPDDRQWCVATEIDFAWTYVGGSETLIQALIQHPKLEGIPTRIDHAITHKADRLNPPPPGRP